MSGLAATDHQQDQDDSQLFPILDCSLPGFDIISHTLLVLIHFLDKQVFFLQAWSNLGAALPRDDISVKRVFDPSYESPFIIKLQSRVVVVKPSCSIENFLISLCQLGVAIFTVDIVDHVQRGYYSLPMVNTPWVLLVYRLVNILLMPLNHDFTLLLKHFRRYLLIQLLILIQFISLEWIVRLLAFE